VTDVAFAKSATSSRNISFLVKQNKISYHKNVLTDDCWTDGMTVCMANLDEVQLFGMNIFVSITKIVFGDATRLATGMTSN
jgi:hypothetical protein